MFRHCKALPDLPLGRWRNVLLVCLAAPLLAGFGDAFLPPEYGLFVQGRYSEALALIEKKAPDMDQAQIGQLNMMCLAHSKLKNYERLFRCLEAMDAHIRRGEVSDMATLSDISAQPAIWRAEAYCDLGAYDKSVAEARSALELIEKKDLKRAFKLQALAVLGLAHALQGDRESASTTVARLEDLGTAFPYTGLQSDKYNGLARIAVALGDYAKAIKYLEQDTPSFLLGFANAISYTRMSSGESIFAYTELPKEFIRNRSLLETSRMEDAKSGFDKLLNRAGTQYNGDIYWMILFDRGRIAEKENKSAEALEYYRKAIDVIERQRSTINTEASKIGFVGDKQAVYGRLIAVLIEQGRAVEAFDYVERSKSRALVDMLAAKKDFAAPDSAQATLVLAQLDAADLNARVQDSAVPAEEKTAGVRNLQVAREALQSAAPELSTLVTVSSVPSAELKALVGPDETLIEYYYQGNDLYAFLLDRERLLALRLDATELSSQVQTLRKTLEATESPAWREPARALYARLWQPLEKMITTRNIIVVAHGALHYLPFAALQDAEGKFLLDRYSLRFLPSASVLKFLRPVLQNKDARLLALGNPDLDDPKLDLAFAEGEAKLVASLYPSSRVLLRRDASESNFKKAGGVFSRIHFASHGKFQADEPLKSGLYLAKDADNDGILTVGELYSMNLEADLVTLSACETGLGKIASGDDVVGLARGFLYAGSRSIVASLWSVDDKATATLMQAFYANLASMNKREALRQAQIKAREAFPHPFFWAAFQLTGRAE